MNRSSILLYVVLCAAAFFGSALYVDAHYLDAALLFLIAMSASHLVYYSVTDSSSRWRWATLFFIPGGSVGFFFGYVLSQHEGFLLGAYTLSCIFWAGAFFLDWISDFVRIPWECAFYRHSMAGFLFLGIVLIFISGLSCANTSDERILVCLLATAFALTNQLGFFFRSSRKPRVSTDTVGTFLTFTFSFAFALVASWGFTESSFVAEDFYVLSIFAGWLLGIMLVLAFVLWLCLPISPGEGVEYSLLMREKNLGVDDACKTLYARETPEAQEKTC